MSGYINREKELIDFNVNDEEHLYAASLLDMDCKQHPTLRFAIRPPFRTVVDMARYDISMKTYQDIRSMRNAKSESPDSNLSNVVVPTKPSLRAVVNT